MDQQNSGNCEQDFLIFTARSRIIVWMADIDQQHTKQKNRLWALKAANPKMQARHLIGHWYMYLNKTPSTSAISQVMQETETLKAAGNAKIGTWQKLAYSL